MNPYIDFWCGHLACTLWRPGRACLGRLPGKFAYRVRAGELKISRIDGVGRSGVVTRDPAAYQHRQAGEP